MAPGNAGSMLAEAVEEQFASFDYTFKANAKAAVKWWRRLPGVKPK
jgi:hypothetical protein